MYFLKFKEIFFYSFVSESNRIFIEPVDNFCYTDKKNTLSEIHGLHRYKYYVIHKLLINLLITSLSIPNRCGKQKYSFVKSIAFTVIWKT